MKKLHKNTLAVILGATLFSGIASTVVYAEGREHQNERREHQAERREHQGERREHQAERREHQAERREHQGNHGRKR